MYFPVKKVAGLENAKRFPNQQPSLFFRRAKPAIQKKPMRLSSYILSISDAVKSNLFL